MQFLRVKNLEKHQHYKDRRPPWIKLHSEVLDDYAFSCLQDASKAHLMLLWVLASRLENRIPYDVEWITRQIGAASPVDVEELISQGFIAVFEDASVTLAPRKQSAMPETETETETEKRKKNPSSRKTATGSKPVGPTFDLAPYLDAHTAAFPGSSPPAARYGKVFKALERKFPPAEVLRRWRNCLAAKGTFATPEELAAHWSEYDAALPPRNGKHRHLTDADQALLAMMPPGATEEEKRGILR
jgi:hypothetical protein